jgi:DNA-binding MarR family transcriptional regulator
MHSNGMRDDEAMALCAQVLGAANVLLDGVHAGVMARGFADLRPAHGFAFARLAPGDATITELAVHLGVTRQAAAQLVDELVAKGYVERRPHPHDRRAQLILLTERGWACTRAAEAAAADTVGRWAQQVGADRLRACRDALAPIVPPGRLRPTW